MELDDPTQTAQKFSKQLQAAAAKIYRPRFDEIAKLTETQQVFDSAPSVQVAFVRNTANSLGQLRDSLGKSKGMDMGYLNLWGEKGYPGPDVQICRRLLNHKLPFSDEDLVFIASRLGYLGFVTLHTVPFVEHIVSLFELRIESGPLSQPLTNAARGLRDAVNCILNAPEQKLVSRLNRVLSGVQTSPILPGEAWSDAAIGDLNSASESRRAKWFTLLELCQNVSGSAPSAKWIKSAKELVKSLGTDEFRRRIVSWFPSVNEPRTQPIAEWHREYQPDPNQLIIEPHSDILKGLVWCCGLREDKEIARELTTLALSAYRKIPLKGPREVKVGNACVIALGMMPGMEGVGQLALLKVRVKFGTAQKMIDKAFEATAARVGIPRDELEEMAVPAYGLTEVGRSTETFGDFNAELTVTGPDSTTIAWLKADGKRQQSVPAVVKEKFAADWKEFQTAAKDIQRMLPAQRERIDNLFREQKSWPFDKWRERYLDHPLVGVLARRLIWEFTSDSQTTTGIFFNDHLVDIDLKPLPKLDETASVRLWHPIGKDADEVVAWRAWLDAKQIQQPFKQAHREIYLLTDAERNTRTYSNRFAAHIIRQHQFNALCGARGWKNKLRLLVDAEFPPATVLLQKWNLRAEFWVEGVGSDYGTDTNDSGVFNYLSTDQVRFYPVDAAQVTSGGFNPGYTPRYGENAAEPLSLEAIPPLVFSEVMRDVDLFVGVASVGNDPTWNDGGPEGRFLDYWNKTSFGELSASAKTRHEVLERLVPKLKIAGKCSFEEKFLVVQGSLRTYKIHLGSGNILMKPNDQYLCIVPKQTQSDDGKVFLPFEGDRTLSVIISKAFLLADDAKITDASIVSQIRR